MLKTLTPDQLTAALTADMIPELTAEDIKKLEDMGVVVPEPVVEEVQDAQQEQSAA